MDAIYSPPPLPEKPDPEDQLAYLFMGLTVGGPAEELRATAEKWIRLHARMGEEEAVAATSRALELAMSTLETVLTAPPRPFGYASTPCPESPALPPVTEDES